MDVRDYMTTELQLCTPLTRVENIKKLMEEKSTDEIFVVDSLLEKHLLGTINVKDIYARSVSTNVPESELNAEQCIRTSFVTVRETASPEECIKLMEKNKITKVAVVDAEGHVCGVIDSANLMRH